MKKDRFGGAARLADAVDASTTALSGIIGDAAAMRVLLLGSNDTLSRRNTLAEVGETL